MSTVATSARDREPESGMVLIMVLLLMMMVSALGSGLVISATTDTLIVRNHHVAAQARAAADAGLSHALEVTVASLRTWSADGYASPSEAMSALLRGPDGRAGSPGDNADNGSLAGLGIPEAGLNVGALSQVSYTARVFDDDDPALGTAVGAADRARIAEDGDAVVDANTFLIVRAVGYGAQKAVAVVEATIAPASFPAVLVNGDLALSGNAAIDGSRGDVHANGNLAIGGSTSVSGDATASGTVTTSGHPAIGGLSAGGRGTTDIAPVRASDYRTNADYLLTDAGTLTYPNGTVICNASTQSNACATAGYAWVYRGGGEWALTGNTRPPAGTYYADGDVTISGSPGSSSNPAHLSVIAEGSIAVSGGPDIVPETTGLLFVTDEDLRITGRLTVRSGAEGQMLVREQAHISGNASLAGRLTIENESSISGLVTSNEISGSARLTYTGAAGSGEITVSGWRRPQD